MKPLDRLLKFVLERESIRIRRANGEPKPWTQDPILQQYRFCNVRREEDAVTQWIAKHWRTPHRDNQDLWFAMVVARYINLPDTLAQIKFPVPWDRRHFLEIMRTRKEHGLKSFNPAYMISTAGQEIYKEVYLANTFSDLWRSRHILRPRTGDTLNSYHTVLGARDGLGSFMTAQVIADLKYVEPLSSAADWFTFAASGPGSRRGLNRALDREVNESWVENDWREELALMQEWLNKQLKWDEPLHAQDVQNCLCEFDKMERARLRQGRPKQKFAGGSTS